MKDICRTKKWCGRTTKRPLTTGYSLNATGMVCIAFRNISSPLVGLPGSTRSTTSPLLRGRREDQKHDKGTRSKP